jgi:endonuclease/exonuclease/phosphatase family metal-dependent hydrolase
LGRFRGVCQANIEIEFNGGTRMIQIYNIHLDHMDENTRLSQLDNALEVFCKNETLKTENNNDDDDDNNNNDLITGHIVVGDFNSMSRKQHYSREAFEKIRNHRRKSHWEAPMFKVYKQMINNSYIDTFWSINNNEKDEKEKEEKEEDFGVTCWAGTRIDYIFASYNFELQLIRSFVVDVDGATDHNCVVSVFQCF